MKSALSRQVLLSASLAAFCSALLSLSGCASAPEAVEEEDVVQTPGGGAALVDTITYVATVSGIDPSTRKVTLTTPDGKSSTFKADPAVNLSNFQVGDEIGVQATEAIAISIKKDGTPASSPAAVALAAVGSDGTTSAMLVGEAVEVSAKVVAIDPSTRKVTFQLADGSTRTVKVSKDIDLSQHSVGETVTLGFAESVILAVSRP